MKYIMKYLKHNPQYSEIISAPIELETLDEFTYRAVLKNILKQCLMMNPEDHNLLVCTGITFFQERDFDRAASYFKLAIKQNPTDYSLWNKYGAAMTNNFKREEA